MSRLAVNVAAAETLISLGSQPLCQRKNRPILTALLFEQYSVYASYLTNWRLIKPKFTKISLKYAEALKSMWISLKLFSGLTQVVARQTLARWWWLGRHPATTGPWPGSCQETTWYILSFP